MKFSKGDKVKLKSNGKEGYIREVTNAMFMEVQCDGDIYFWQTSGVEKVEENGDFDFNGFINEYYANTTTKEVKRCTCSNWDLFHFGCKCGAFKSEQEKKDALQRERERGDLDRENG